MTTLCRMSTTLKIMRIDVDITVGDSLTGFASRVDCKNHAA